MVYLGTNVSAALLLILTLSRLLSPISQVLNLSAGEAIMWPSTLLPAAPRVLSVLSLILPTALAVVPLEGYGKDDYPLLCGAACVSIMPYSLDCPEYAAMSAVERATAYPSPSCFANNEPYLTSLAWCIYSYCPKDTKRYEIESYWEQKMIYRKASPAFSYAEALDKIDKENPPKPMSLGALVLNRTISVNSAIFEAALNGNRGYSAVIKNESKYSLLVSLSCVLMPIGFSLLRFLPFPGSIRRKFNAYLIDPPAWGKKHKMPTLGLGLVPTRGQALFILYIIAVNVLATFEGYPYYTPNAVFPDRRYAMIRLIGNRAGVIAFANLPILMLYAGRNSLLLRMTNWSHSTFLLLHRWVATICVIQVILHSVLWLQLMVEAGSHALVVKLPYWYWGILGTLTFSLLLPFSVLPIRKVMYEVFLVTHICLTVLAIVGSWYHIWYLYTDTGGFEIWLIIAIVFWVYERLLRIIRVSRHGIKKAYVTRIDDQYLRVDIPDVNAHGHCYVYFPTLSWRVWENHPFSVVSYSSDQSSGSEQESDSNSSSHVQFETQGASSTEEGLTSKEAGITTSNARPASTNKDHARPGITLLVQNLKGFTARLAKRADCGVGIPVLIECSYGHEPYSHFAPTAEHPNTLVIAGGVGIAGVLSALQSSLSLFAKPTGTTKLYWGIKKRGLVDAVKRMVVGEEASKEEGNGELSHWGHVETHVTIGSRMDIKQLITDEVEKGLGGTTVVVCGPDGMCDDARNVCAGLARQGAKVRYVEEAFSW